MIVSSLLDAQLFEVILEGFEHVGLHVDEVHDALSFQLGRAGRSAGHHEDRTSGEQFLHFGGGFGVVVVARADHHDFGLGGQSGLDTLFDRLEERVVHHLDAGAGEEVARELGAGAGHGEAAAGEHEGFGGLAAAVDVQTHLFESHGAAVGCQRVAFGCGAFDDGSGDFTAGGFVELAKVMGFDTTGLTLYEAAQKSIDGMREMCRLVGIPSSIKEIGAKPEDFEMMAKNALKDGNAFSNPRKGTVEDIVKLYQKAYDGIY